MKHSIQKSHVFALVASLALFPGVSFAARAWILPSQTIIANSGGWVAFDTASADDLFSVNQGALPLDQLVITTPDGSALEPQNAAKGRSRSIFDLELRKTGTYRVALAGDTVMARWEEDGKPKRWRGTPAEMAANIPANAAKLEIEQMQRRIETYVTVGKPSEVRSVGAGLELVPLTHPNDLYAGESARLKFLLDGRPAKDLEIEIVVGGTRYRDAPNETRVKTDKDGVVTVTWPAAGLYWVDASVEDEKATVPNVKKRHATYNATLEVLTQ
ncbi:MAG: DUF4198 domain-containing protein [Steroidobacteraceae bacterium]|nr:DUF4198 domain-containing protein [Steroidobacteraceae bacterium]